MQQNIFINNVELVRANLIFDKYYDFKLSKGQVYDYKLAFKDIASFDFAGIKKVPNRIFSNSVWDKAMNRGVILNNIGLTAVDNGFIYFNGRIVTDEELFDIFKNHKFELFKGDTRLFLTRVHDNVGTDPYDIGIDPEGKYLSFKGGFYQGFFKLENECYEVLPATIQNEMEVSITLRPRKDYNGGPESNFFYIGTRAENKFAPFYNKDYTMINGAYFTEDFLDDDSFLNDEDYLEENPYEDSGDATTIDEIQVSDGTDLIEQGQEAVETDNKFIFFNNTENGFTTETWEEGDKVSLITEKHNIPNLFPVMHYGENGKTTEDIDEIEEESALEYNINADVAENALSFFVTKNGEIGYRYAVKNCDMENHIEILKEVSKPGLVKNNEWSSIRVIFNKLRDGAMKLNFYVNGFLILVSKQLPELNLRALNDNPKKQEGVAYNISLGGGTFGLKNVVYPSGYMIHDQNYVLENNFSDSFYGDIMNFEIKEKTI